jgi:hypothetical protein
MPSAGISYDSPSTAQVVPTFNHCPSQFFDFIPITTVFQNTTLPIACGNSYDSSGAYYDVGPFTAPGKLLIAAIPLEYYACAPGRFPIISVYSVGSTGELTCLRYTAADGIPAGRGCASMAYDVTADLVASGLRLLVRLGDMDDGNMGQTTQFLIYNFACTGAPSPCPHPHHAALTLVLTVPVISHTLKCL